MGRIILVSGIDTDIGKTVCTGMLARYLHHNNLRVITMKLVQTGNDGFSEDLAKHRELMGVPQFPEDAEGLTAPQIFHFPSSPHLAAALEHRVVATAAIRRAAEELARRYDLVLAEAAGGLMVPLTPQLLTIDFAAQCGWQTILVASGRLGSLNHILLSLEACRHHRLPIAGIIYHRRASEDAAIADETARFTRQWLRDHQLPDRWAELPEIDFNSLPECDFSALSLDH